MSDDLFVQIQTYLDAHQVARMVVEPGDAFFLPTCMVGVTRDWLRRLMALLAEKDATIARLTAGVRAVNLLIAESYGVAGLHLNGDDAPWTELRTGGRFESWLKEFDAALEEQP